MTPAMKRPPCEFCEALADYHHPETGLDYCKAHAIEHNVLTDTRVWLWNDRQKRWNR